MTPTQQAALQALYTAHGGATLTAQQVTDLTPLVAARNDAGIAAYLSPGLMLMGTVPISTFAAWTAQTGLRAVIETTAVNTTSPLRSVALTLLDVLHGAAQSLDFSVSAVGQGNVAMLGAWVTAGALTAAQEAQLLALAQQPHPLGTAEISQALIGA